MIPLQHNEDMVSQAEAMRTLCAEALIELGRQFTRDKDDIAAAVVALCIERVRRVKHGAA